MARKVLLLTQVLPYPPDAEPKIKTLNTLRYLAREGNEVVLLSLFRSSSERAYGPHLAQYCREVRMVQVRRSPAKGAFYLLRSLLANEPFLISRDYSEEFSLAVKSAMADHSFDLVHADQLNMAQCAVGITISAGDGEKANAGASLNKVFPIYFRCNTLRSIDMVFEQVGFKKQRLFLVESSHEYVMASKAIFLTVVLYEGLLEALGIKGFGLHVVGRWTEPEDGTASNQAGVAP